MFMCKLKDVASPRRKKSEGEMRLGQDKKDMQLLWRLPRQPRMKRLSRMIGWHLVCRKGSAKCRYMQMFGVPAVWHRFARLCLAQGSFRELGQPQFYTRLLARGAMLSHQGWRRFLSCFGGSVCDLPDGPN